MAGAAVRRRRRSLLVFPATEPRMARKAAESNADSVIFDFEDSVPFDKKADARSMAIDTLAELDFGDKEICVRINAVGSELFDADVEAVNALPGVNAVMVPKVESSDDVLRLDAALSAAGVKLHLAVESPRGMFAAQDFAQASARVESVMFGSGDFVASSGFSSDESALLFPRSYISLIASSLGIDALDLAIGGVRDLEPLRRSSAAGRALGYVGKWAIHPGQVDVINEAFSPTEEELVRARRILDAMSEGRELGKGALLLDGVLIDEASIRLAESLIERASPPSRDSE